MKHGKSPNKRQKLAIKAHNLNHGNWLVFKDLGDELHLVHRLTGSTRIIASYSTERKLSYARY